MTTFKRWKPKNTSRFPPLFLKCPPILPLQRLRQANLRSEFRPCRTIIIYAAIRILAQYSTQIVRQAVIGAAAANLQFAPRCVSSDKPQQTARIPEPIVGA